MKKSKITIHLACSVLLCLLTGSRLVAQSIPVPNGSFESPATAFVDTRVDNWQKAPKPAGYDESSGFTWDQLAGVFLNVAPTNSAYIDNSTGAQGLYLFAVPTVAVYQDKLTNPAFTPQFEPGKSYNLTVGVIGGGGNMTNGVSLELALYYRDATSNMVTVAATNLIYSSTTFPNTTHYLDFTVQSPVINAGDPAAGHDLGILLLSTVSPNLSGGYWDLDNVRLSGTASTNAGPTLQAAWNSGKFQLTLQSTPGVYQVLASAALGQPASAWPTIATLTNVTGSATFLDTATNLTSRFYTVRQGP